MKRLLSLAVIAVLAAANACAQTEESNKCYNEGVRLYKQKKYSAAIPCFEKSDSIDKATLDSTSNRRNYSAMWLAHCHANIGDSIKAAEIDSYYVFFSPPIDRNATVESDSLASLASKLIEKKDYERAAEMLQKCAAIEKEVAGENSVWRASTVWSLADCYIGCGNDEEAFKCVEIAHKICAQNGMDDMKLTEIYSYFCQLCVARGKIELAVSMYLDALRIFGKRLGKENNYYISCLYNLAQCYDGIANYKEAIRYRAEMAQLWAKTFSKEDVSYATTLEYLAGEYIEIGNYDEAIKSGTEALRILEKVSGKDNPDYAITLVILSRCYHEEGNDSEAMRLSTDALPILKEAFGNDSIAYAALYAGALSIIGSCYEQLGNYDKALEAQTEALRIRGKVLGKETTGYALSLNNLAMTYSSKGDHAEAIKLETEAVHLFERLSGKDNASYATCLNNLANEYTEVGNYEESMKLLTEVRQIYEQNHSEDLSGHETLLNNLAIYNFENSNYGEATRLENECLRITEQIKGKSHPDYIKGLGNLMGFYYIQGTDTAKIQATTLEFLDRSRKYVLDQFAGLTSQQRQSFWKMWEMRIIDFVPRLATVYCNSDSLVQAVYNVALLTKGLLLNTDIEMRKLIQESGDTAMLRKLNELAQTRKIIENHLSSGKAERTLKIDSLQSRADMLEAELVRGSKAYGDYTRSFGIDWRQVQSKLSARDLAIEFISFHADTALYLTCALVLKKGMEAPKLVRLFNNKKESRINNYSTTELYNYVWKGLEEYTADADNIYFAPTGVLYSMAIENVPIDSTGTLMSDRWNMYRVSSTRELALAKDKPARAKAAVYGGLKYDAGTDVMIADSRKRPNRSRSTSIAFYSIADSLTNFRNGVDSLPETRTEAMNIERLLERTAVQTDCFTDSLGTETSFKDLSGKRKNLLHIATHGFYYTEKTAKRLSDLSFLSLGKNANSEDKALTRSGLLFAGANNALTGKKLPEDVDDGILTAKEIAAIDLRGLDLVVLSACRTGLGEVEGDGVFGLQRGFKKAGANSILMSLWKVDDKATQLLMTQFYANLVSGKSKHESLKQAQKYVREYETEETIDLNANLTPNQRRQEERKGNKIVPNIVTRKTKPYENPKFWAAFILLDAIDNK